MNVTVKNKDMGRRLSIYDSDAASCPHRTVLAF